MSLWKSASSFVRTCFLRLARFVLVRTQTALVRLLRNSVDDLDPGASGEERPSGKAPVEWLLRSQPQPPREWQARVGRALARGLPVQGHGVSAHAPSAVKREGTKRGSADCAAVQEGTYREDQPPASGALEVDVPLAPVDRRHAEAGTGTERPYARTNIVEDVRTETPWCGSALVTTSWQGDRREVERFANRRSVHVPRWNDPLDDPRVPLGNRPDGDCGARDGSAWPSLLPSEALLDVSEEPQVEDADREARLQREQSHGSWSE